MFMQFFVVGAIAIGLIQLGALSVWVAVLSLALKMVLLLAIAAALYFGLPLIWRWHKDHKQGK